MKTFMFFWRIFTDMKVVFFQPYLANWRIQFLSRYIKESENEVLVYDGGFKSRKDLKSVSNRTYLFDYKRLVSFSFEFFYRKQAYPIYFSPGLLFHLIKDRPDVVVTEGEINFLNNISVFLYCFFFRKSYVWWSLGKVRTRKENLLNRIFDPIVKFLLLRANCVLTRNTYARDYYVDFRGVPPGRIIIAPNSMDDQKARSEVRPEIVAKLRERYSDGPVILYVGALVPDKRPADALEAFSHVIRDSRFPSARLWFVGDGPERDRLEKEVEKRRLQNRVIFFGSVFEGVGNYFKASDLVVVPGLGGLVINHAMILGKPVVSRMADGTELDLVESGITGELVLGEDIELLGDAIKRCLSPELLYVMSDRAGQRVRDSWNMDIMISRFEEAVKFAGKK